MKSPAFQWYPGDYLGSQRVQLMSLEEEGAYMRLLCYCWLHGSIPAEPEQAARLIGKGASTTLATTVLTMFQPGGSNRLIHDRLEAERKKQADWRRKSSNGGKKSAEKRAKSATQPSGKQHQPEGSLPNGTNQMATLQSSVFCLQSSLDVGKTPPAKAEASSDDDWMRSLEADTAYAGVDVRREFAKMKTWCLHNHKQPTRRRFINWLNRCERPVNGHHADAASPAPSNLR